MKKLLLPIALCFLVMSQDAFAQSRPVKGQVLDEDGNPVPGASVQVKGTKSGTITDVNGNFTLEVPDDESTLVITSIGYQPEEVEAGDGLNALRIQVEGSTTRLNETVIVGYGTASYKELAGAYNKIDEEAFQDVPLGSFTNMLQGKAPGVQVTSQNGAPGSSAFIRIRGTSSLTAGNEPLIVIDGVPANGDALNAINSNDIVDVSVLKDASTTSIYGSRGANGVIVVTTRKGKMGGDQQAKVSYGMQYGWKSKTPDKYDMMSFDQKLKWERDFGYTNMYLQALIAPDGYASIADVPDAEVGKYWDQLRPYETNWLSQTRGENPILRVGHFQQQDLSITGGTDKLSYYFSGQLYDEDGISRASFFDRKSANLNVEYQAKPWLKAGQNVRAVYSKGSSVRDRFNVQNPFAAMYFYNPYESPYDFSPSGINGFNATTQGFNLVEGLINNTSLYNETYILSSSFLEVNPIEHLRIRTQFGLQYSNRQEENFTRPGSILDLILNGQPVGSKTDYTYNNFGYTWSNVAEYNRTFNEDHDFTALIGTEYNQINFKSYTLTSTGYPFGVSTQNNGATPTVTRTERTGSTMMSYFARLKYNYQGKYFANLSARRDGSSRFGEDFKYGTFFAGGAAWLLSEENFLRGSKDVNMLKLWGALGTSGNNNIGNYTHLSYYRFGSYGPTNAAYPYSVGNQLLTWERNTNYSIGLDFTLFQNIVSGTIDYYGRYTKDMLLDMPLSPTTGFPTQKQNVGSMTNNGMELSLNVNILRGPNLTWSVGGNFTYNRNKVIDIGGVDSVPSLYSLFGMYAEGHPVDVYYMKKYAGINQETGAAQWYDAAGKPTSEYGDAGLFILEDKAPDPKYFGGFYTTLAYKGFDLAVNFTYSGGNWTYNNQWMQANSAGNYYTNLAANLTDYWTEDNKDAKNPALDENDVTYDSDRWLEKADYIRLRNVTLGYTFPDSWFNNKIHGLRLYVQAQNLWYYAPGYHGDPEIGIGSSESDLTRVGNTSLYSYPQSKAFTIGLHVSL